MHELSIAMSIVDMAREEAERRGVRIEAVYLRLGPLSGVVTEALLSCYDVVSAQTPMEGSRLVIEETTVKVFCDTCAEERELNSIQDFTCSVCGQPTPQVLQGKELEVVALEIQP